MSIKKMLARPRFIRMAGIAAVAIMVMCIMMGGLPQAAFAEGKRSASSVVFGGPVYVAPDETVEGGVVSFGGKVTVEGRVAGDAVSIGGPVEVNGTVDGDVVSVGSQVTLGQNARVRGDVTSVGGTVYRAEGATVEGDVTTAGFPFKFGFHGMMWPGVRWLPRHMPWEMFGVMWFMRLIGALVLPLVIVAIWPGHTASVAGAVESRLGRVALTGLVAWLLLIPGAILLGITLVGIPLIPVWVLLYIAAGIFGHAAIALLVGGKVEKLANTAMSELVRVLVGALIIALLGWVPVVGAIIGIAVGVIGLGAVLDTRFGTNRPWFPPRQPAPSPKEPPKKQGE